MANKHGPSPRACQHDVRPSPKFGPRPKPLADRFWAKVQKSDGFNDCWPWMGHVNGKMGYGMIYDADVGDKMLAHRVAWKLEHGQYPDGVVRHLCDNPACVRIDHLVEGTQADNMREKVERSRDKNQYHSVSEDTATQIRELYRTNKYSQERLGEMFGIDQTTVSRIVRNARIPKSNEIFLANRIVPNRSPRFKRTVEERFWSKVDKGDDTGCWIWKAAVVGNVDPRGCLRVGGTTKIAYRLSWEWANGPIPEGMEVCHKCDVGLCVRPDHLFLGTHADNMADRAKKGRFGHKVVVSNGS